VRALVDGEFCIWHDPRPEIVEKRDQGRQYAGRRPVIKNLEGMPAGISSAKDILQALDGLYKGLSRQDITSSSTAAMLRVLREALKAVELTTIEDRLSELEGGR
jgi:hypothetical protein